MTEGIDKLGLAVRRSDGGRIVLRAAPQHLAALLELGLLDGREVAAVAGAAPVALGGRGVPVRLPLHGGAAIVKTLARGGLAGRFRRAGYRSPQRLDALVELQLALQDRGVPVAPFAFARSRARGGRFALEFATLEVVGARDAAARFAEPLARRERRALLRAAGAAVRALHAAGVRHHDLNAKNLLLAAAPARVWLIDFDGSALPAAALAPEDPRVVANLARLLRSAEKLGLWRPRGSPLLSAPVRVAAPLADRDLTAFLRGYYPDGSRGSRRRLARAIVAAYRRSIFWHRLGWRWSLRRSAATAP